MARLAAPLLVSLVLTFGPLLRAVDALPDGLYAEITTPRDLVEGGAFHEVKEAFLSAARVAGDADFAQQQKTAPPDKPPPPAQRLKLQTDAVLDGLIAKLEPKP